MRILTGIAFFANLLLWLAGVLSGFIMGSWVIGLPVLLGFIGFIIGWHLSGGIAVAPADYFFQPEWDVFKTKLKWSNGTGITVGFISLLMISLFY
ncbi:MAG TPA: hypothetical protein VE870_17205 [Bacteroidales bacterium]|nr:hypothetical protein [Bacteroidales bacterium]